MAVLGIAAVTLEVPELEAGIKFYTDAGLSAEVTGGVAKLCCKGQQRPSIVLIGGAPYIAFTCARRNSDHHVVAFAKSPGVGFHHASFEVCSPDEVGRGGGELLGNTGKGAWGFGRHTIGSNFFYYIQDPWGSWFEYYADMDYIEDYSAWTATNYGMEDSLANWGPAVPEDFVHNYEIGGDT